MIVFDSVSFSYPQKPVLRDFSMHVEPGERGMLSGASGAGKTTVLRLILGLETPQSGTLTVGTDRVSVLFQEDRLLPFYTVMENIGLVSPTGRAFEVLDALGLSDCADLYPSKLSGGMARRVSLARALCFDADLYLFDEPFTGLDADSARVSMDAIARYTKGKTVVSVSHIPAPDPRFFDREIPLSASADG